MKKIGKYEICGLLGKGGMGIVYKARVPVIGKVVALKLLSPHPNLVALLGKEEIRRNFVTEAMTMASLRHPHIAAVWDFHDSDNLTFFVMEYYCNNLGTMIGETYRVEEPSRTVAVDKAIDYTRQILVGLSRLHEAHIVHRLSITDFLVIAQVVAALDTDLKLGPKARVPTPYVLEFHLDDGTAQSLGYAITGGNPGILRGEQGLFRGQDAQPPVEFEALIGELLASASDRP